MAVVAIQVRRGRVRSCGIARLARDLRLDIFLPILARRRCGRRGGRRSRRRDHLPRLLIPHISRSIHRKIPIRCDSRYLTIVLNRRERLWIR